MRAEAEFVAKIRELHPDAPKPIIVGNCQGGWATPDPGRRQPRHHRPAGRQRRAGRLLVGPARREPDALQRRPARRRPAGARALRPRRRRVRRRPSRLAISRCSTRAATTSASTTTCSPRPRETRKSFLEFEKWWGGFHFMNEQEIRWIVEHLFIGNKLARHEANLEHGRPIDLKAIRSPIIVFASLGRQHHAAAAGAELDRRHLRRRARDQDPRPAHHLHGARQGRPSRHLRLLLDRQEGARRGHLDDEDDRGAGARASTR